jgi:hypothetical protein
LTKTIDDAPDYLKETLEKYPRHQPHFALFLTFLKLFKYAQDHLNQFTRRHLEFYYGEILQLRKKPATPDRVHLIFELAKNASPYAVIKDTALKAGKDETGVNLTYKTDKELVVNSTRIGRLKTLFLQRESDGQDLKVKGIYAAPQANSKDGAGTPFDTEIPKWKTFGEPQSDKDPAERTMADATLGFAIASPQLFLGQGKRIIKANFTFEEDGLNLTFLNNVLEGSHFTFHLSGEKEWITPGDCIITFETSSMNVQLTVNEEQPAIVAYDSAVLGGGLETSYPVLRILLNPSENPYEFLKNLEISEINLNLEVSNMNHFVLQNDQGLLDPNKPFLPFGTTPVIGSALYIGSEEIFNKKVDRIKIIPEWQDLPAGGFNTHYTGYGNTYQPANDSVFKVDASVLLGRSWQDPLTETPKALFNEDGFYEYSNAIDQRSTGIEKIVGFSNLVKRGFIRLVLGGHDFNHKVYATVLATAIADDSNPPIPREPYTPVISRLTMEYDSDQPFEAGVDQFFHIRPFGDVETEPITPEQSDGKQKKSSLIVKTQYLVPRFTVDDVEQEGFFYLELEGLVPSQNVAVLFKIAEGSGNAELPVPEINWCYLEDNTWQKFDRKDLLSDTTNGLLTTGIIEFAIPSRATSNNTILPASTHWLRASVSGNSAAISQLIAVKAQAVTARFEDNKNDPEHLKTPLPDNRIAKLETRVPQIKSVSQPYASFGGKVEELEVEYYRRVSERLRHKGRGVNIWDYEHLILENFPAIYKVKCLNHTNPDCETAPGHVTIVPISNLRNQNAIDLLQPKTSLNTLQEIKSYLSKLISPFIHLEVKNPLYEKILVDFYVQFKPGVDKGYYANRLIDEIIKFLSPWAYDEGSDIVFGEKIHSSSIIDFIEERDDYVDYITDFKMYQFSGETVPLKPVEEAAATSSRSILVSADYHEVRY